MNLNLRWFSVLGLLLISPVSSKAAPRLAFQVYAVRDLCAKDFPGTLKAVKH